MVTRVLSAVVALSLLLPMIIFGGVLAVDVLLALVLLICLDEYARMAFPDDNMPALVWLCLGSALVYAGPIYAGPEYALLFTGLACLGTFVWVIARLPGTTEGAADRVGRYLLGLAWIPGLMAFIPLLRRLDDGLLWVFLLMIVPWASDTGGYFAGRAFGSHKMSPLVSPKKTWEGFVGGIVLAVVCALAYRALVFPLLTVADCLFLGAVLAAVGVVGDLAESLVKRAYDVKDSGWILPGHGGLLDRIDALMFVGPLLYAYAVWVKA